MARLTAAARKKTRNCTVTGMGLPGGSPGVRGAVAEDPGLELARRHRCSAHRRGQLAVDCRPRRPGGQRVVHVQRPVAGPGRHPQAAALDPGGAELQVVGPVAVDDERLRVRSRLVVRVPPAGEVGRVGAVDRDLAVAEPVQAGAGLKVGRIDRALGQQGGRVRQAVAVRVAERGRGAGGGVLLGRDDRELASGQQGRGRYRRDRLAAATGSVSSLPLVRTRRLNLYRTAAGGAAGMPDRGQAGIRYVRGRCAVAAVRRSSRANLPAA